MQIKEFFGLPATFEVYENTLYTSVLVTENHALYGKKPDFILPIDPRIATRQINIEKCHISDYQIFKGTGLNMYGIPLSVYMECPGGLRFTGYNSFYDSNLGKEVKLWAFGFIVESMSEALEAAEDLAGQLIDYQLNLNYRVDTVRN